MLLLLLCFIPLVLVQETGNISSTQDPLDLFREQGFPQIPQESQPFGNFDLEPQQPKPTPRTTTPPPFFQDNSQSFQPTRKFRPQNVNEQGIPLPEISSIDPATRDPVLWSGPDPFEERCPRNWERFENSCYKFTRSPIKRWSDARELCRAYRHGDQDKADLASVDTFKEHM